MPATPPPPDDLDLRDDLLDRADAFVARLIALACSLLEASPPTGLAPALCRRLLRHVIAPAEAAFRRALVIVAASLPALALRAPRLTAPVPPVARPFAGADAPRRPSFRLTEPQHRPPTAGLAPGPRPRITFIGDPRPAPPRPEADPAAITARLARRLDALIDAFNNPARAIRRLQRRALAEPARPLLRLSPAPHLIAREHPAPDRDLFAALNACAAADLPALRNTS